LIPQSAISQNHMPLPCLVSQTPGHLHGGMLPHLALLL
jgi:hypothetical protein